jgi:glycosyltransferase involved in cell wall biosynthesis
LSSSELQKAKSEIAALRNQIEDYKSQIEQLTQKNAELTTANDGLNQTLTAEQMKTAEQARTIDSKNRTIGIAKKLNAGSIMAMGVRERKMFGKKELETNKANKVEEIKVRFSIDKNEAREILGIKKDTTVLTCVGRLHEQKNHDLLVRMMKHLENVHLYCAGDGPLHNQIINQIEKEEVKEKIILLGDLDRPKVQLLLRASDIFIIPSIYEGLSNSLLEAMSYGLPVVFSDIPSFTKFLKIEDEDNYAGILVKGNDEKIWAQSVDSLIKDQELASNIRKKSLEKISTLTAEKMTQKFLNLLK